MMIYICWWIKIILISVIRWKNQKQFQIKRLDNKKIELTPLSNSQLNKLQDIFSKNL
jgi:hypothetical protein